jgi:hypothetical protein
LVRVATDPPAVADGIDAVPPPSVSILYPRDFDEGDILSLPLHTGPFAVAWRFDNGTTSEFLIGVEGEILPDGTLAYEECHQDPMARPVRTPRNGHQRARAPSQEADLYYPYRITVRSCIAMRLRYAGFGGIADLSPRRASHCMMPRPTQ